MNPLDLAASAGCGHRAVAVQLPAQPMLAVLAVGYNCEHSRISAEAVFLIYVGQQLSSSFLFVHQISLKKHKKPKNWEFSRTGWFLSDYLASSNLARWYTGYFIPGILSPLGSWRLLSCAQSCIFQTQLTDGMNSLRDAHSHMDLLAQGSMTTFLSKRIEQ